MCKREFFIVNSGDIVDETCSIIMVAWEIWKHRNACVFEGVSPSVQVILQAVKTECTLWCFAGDAPPVASPRLGLVSWSCVLILW